MPVPGCAAVAPVKIPIKVIPICIVDRNRPGLVAKVRAARAPRCPSSASGCSRARRTDTMASSDMTKKPFNTISRIMMASSSRNSDRVELNRDNSDAAQTAVSPLSRAMLCRAPALAVGSQCRIRQFQVAHRHRPACRRAEAAAAILPTFSP